MEKLQAWLEQFNMAGIGCPLSRFEQIFASADDEISKSLEYQYMCGLYHGRLLHEVLGGVDGIEKQVIK